MPLYKLNPMTGIVTAFKEILYYGRFPSFGLLIYPLAISLGVLLTGYLAFKGSKGVFPEEA